MILINNQSLELKKNRRLPNLKSSFGSLDWHTPIILNVVGRKRIRKIKNVNRELPSAFLRFLNKNGKKGEISDWKTLRYEGKTYEGRKASKKYLITQLYSLALPTCIHFNLISQQKPNEMLTFYGRKLLKVLKTESVSRLSQSKIAFDVFRKIVRDKDAKSWGILTALKEIKESNLEKLVKVLLRKGVSIRVSTKAITRKAREKIIRDLHHQGMIRNSSDIIRFSDFTNSKLKEEIEASSIINRKAILRNLLSLYVFLGLIDKKGSFYRINSDEINRINDCHFWNETIENEDFFRSMETVYSNIAANRGDLIPIPIIRDEVCRMNEIPWEVFDKKIVEIGYEYDGNRISLSRPIISKKWGTFIGKINYYYLSISEVEG